MEDEEKELKKGHKAYLQRVVNQFKEDAENALNSIEELRANLIAGKEGEPSLIEKFRTTETELASIKESIQTIHAAIFEEDANGQTRNDAIKEFKESFEKRKSEIIGIQNDILGFYNN